jgi:hypothetical protein
MTRSAPLAACLALVVATASASGYVAGRSGTPNAADAQAATSHARASSERKATAVARKSALDRGTFAGSRTGTRAGSARGRRDGAAKGREQAGRELAVIEQQQQALADRQAQAARSDPCAPGNGHGEYNVPGSFISPSLGYCVPPNGLEPEG